MKNKVGFIGAGNMANAIILSIAGKKYEQKEVAVFDISEEKRSFFAKKGITVEKTAADLVKNTEIVFLTIKPANLNEALDAIKAVASTQNVFVSVVAGVSSKYIKEKLDNLSLSVVRVMPNTPALLGVGATAVAFDENISEKNKQIVCDIFESVGICRVLDESLMNEVVSVNGSSPAYAYMFIKALIDGGVKQGIAPDVAKDLAVQTLLGSVEMIKNSPLTVEELIKAVCSPKGTTLEAVKVLNERNFEETVIAGMEACTKRTKELEDEIRG